MSKQERNRLMALVRETTRINHRVQRAHRRVATGKPQAAKVWMIVAGISLDSADRFASAFSRGVTPTATTRGKVKRRKNSRRSIKTVPVKLYDRNAAANRLRTYVPKDPTVALEFMQAAL